MSFPRRLNQYTHYENYTIGKAFNTGVEFIIDKEDFNKICHYTWRENHHGYIETKINHGSKRIFIHRIIMGIENVDWKIEQCDHIDRDKRNNRKSNLRICSFSVNQINKYPRKDNITGTTGITYDKRCKNSWRAYINYNGKRIYSSVVATKEECIKERIILENKYYPDL